MYLWRRVSVATCICGDVYLWRRVSVATCTCGDVYLWRRVPVAPCICGDVYLGSSSTAISVPRWSTATGLKQTSTDGVAIALTKVTDLVPLTIPTQSSKRPLPMDSSFTCHQDSCRGHQATCQGGLAHDRTPGDCSLDRHLEETSWSWSTAVLPRVEACTGGLAQHRGYSVVRSVMGGGLVRGLGTGGKRC